MIKTEYRILAIVIILCIFIHDSVASDSTHRMESQAGLNEYGNFSLYQPNYFIFGPNDLKLQFSFKYRLANSAPLYLSFSQLMFWNIYDKSKPFRDINYLPETFYRLLDKKESALKSIDIGFIHTSNGKMGRDSRSVDRYFLRTNYLNKINRHNIDLSLMLHNSFNQEYGNRDIEDHIGHWDLRGTISDIIVFKGQSLDFEGRVFAGRKFTNFDQGAYQIGLIYNIASNYMSPAFYLQRYVGYAENLLEYNQRHAVTRLGLLLSY